MDCVLLSKLRTYCHCVKLRASKSIISVTHYPFAVSAKIQLGDSDTRVMKSDAIDIIRFSMMTHSYQAAKSLRIFMYFIYNTE